MTQNSTLYWAFAALVMGAIAMGISPVFVRLAEVGPFASAFWRVFLALPLLYVWSAIEIRRSDKRTSSLLKFNGPILLAGLFFAGDLIFWHLAILNTTIANATLLSCLAPIWVALLSGITIGEPINRRTVYGLLLCLAGASLLIGSSFTGSSGNLIGDLYGLITSMFFGLYFLAVRVARRTETAGKLTLKSTIITALILLCAALIAGTTFWPTSWTGVGSLLALGLVSHAGGQGLLAIALGALSAVFASLVIFIEAIAAAIAAWLILSEQLSPIQFVGGALILSGVWTARPVSRG